MTVNRRLTEVNGPARDCAMHRACVVRKETTWQQSLLSKAGDGCIVREVAAIFVFLI